MQSLPVSENLKVVRRKNTALEAPRKTVSVENGSLPESEYRSLAEKIAKHRVYQRGCFLGILKEAFPTNKHMWTISRYFPYSEHGPLYVDEPIRTPEIRESKAKLEVLKKHGMRMIILEPGSTFQSALEQLAEFPCPGPQQSQT